MFECKFDQFLTFSRYQQIFLKLASKAILKIDTPNMSHKTKQKNIQLPKIIGSQEINHFLRNIQVILMNSQHYYPFV